MCRDLILQRHDKVINLFSFKKKKKLAFMSYRNWSIDGEIYPNFNIVRDLCFYLKRNNFCDDVRIAPPKYFLPEGALLSPENIIDFLNFTLRNMDDCAHFVALKNDYFIDNDPLKKCTSMWTEAELMLWKRYSRKERVFYLVEVQNEQYQGYEHKIDPLNDYLSTVLAKIFINMDPNMRGVPFNWGKYSKYKLLGCQNPQCSKYFLINLDRIKSFNHKNELMNCPCNCGNKFGFEIVVHKNNKYWVAIPSIRSKIDPFPFEDVLPLLILTKEKDIEQRIMIIDWL